MIDPDLPASAILSAEEAAEYYRAKRNKALSCNDGACGGCPRCGVPQDEPKDDDPEH